MRWLWPNLGGEGVVGGLVDDLSVGFAICRKDWVDEQLVDLVCWLLVERDLMASKPAQSNSSSSICLNLRNWNLIGLRFFNTIIDSIYLLRQVLTIKVMIAAVPAVTQARSNQRRTPSTHNVTGLVMLLLSARMMVGAVRFSLILPWIRFELRLRMWAS